MLPLIAESMGLPLFTRYIKGKAVEIGPEYGDRSKGGEGSGSKGDETEDLTELLRDVMVSEFCRNDIWFPCPFLPVWPSERTQRERGVRGPKG